MTLVKQEGPCAIATMCGPGKALAPISASRQTPPLHCRSLAMARLPRLTLPDLPHHVMQRSHEGLPLVRDDVDRQAFVQLLREVASELPVAVHAYALLDDQFRLVLTPRSPDALSKLVQSLGRRYVSQFNRRHARSGSLWAGRFRATVLDPARYLLPCMVDVETHPVRAGAASQAGSYAWSSCAHHLGQRLDPLVSDPTQVWQLGNTPFEREAAWRRMLEEGSSTAQSQAIAQATRTGWALGSEGFVDTLQHSAARPLKPRARGRPRKSAA